MTHTPGTAGLTFASPGVYAVAFAVAAVEPNQIALFINDVLVPGTIFGSGAGTQQNGGLAIVNVSSGDVVTVRNHTSAAAFTLQTLAGGTAQTTNASLRVEKLD